MSCIATIYLQNKPLLAKNLGGKWESYEGFVSWHRQVMSGECCEYTVPWAEGLGGAGRDTKIWFNWLEKALVRGWIWWSWRSAPTLMIPWSCSVIALGKEHHRPVHLTSFTLFLVKKGIFFCQEKFLCHSGREAEDGPPLPPSSGTAVPDIQNLHLGTDEL